MLEALILTLREGVEAALVVGIIVAFLRKRGGERHLGAVWTGIAAAVAASLAGAWILYRVAVNEEAFEGILYLSSAVIVGTLIVWMWRHSHALAGEMRGMLDRILDREQAWMASLGLFLFTFLMVFREGIETVLFLSAVSLSTSGLASFFGAALGIAAAVVFGVLFVRGSLRIDLGRFFKITGITLMIFVLQLLVNGYHELSEAGWLPANATTMAVIGPLVRNEFFFIAAVLLLPLLMLIVPGRGAAAPAAEAGSSPESAAAARLERARAARLRRARLAGGVLGIVILAVLSFGFVYSRPAAELSPATPVELGPDGSVRLALDRFEQGQLERFAVEVDGHPVRFIAVRLDQNGDDPNGAGEVVTAFDACLICGDKGYIQDGTAIACLHCHSAIYPPSIGQPGGCNPVPLSSRIENGELVISIANLREGAPAFNGGSHGQH